MARIRYLVVVFISALIQIGSANVPEKIDLTVYYESKCSDSRDFIVDHLQPAMNLLHESLVLNLVPFGKADSIIKKGQIEFKCQHGPSECSGNLVQDCALEAMAGRSDLEKVNYVICEMETKAGTTGDLSCVTRANISEEEVEKCMYSERGIQLQLDSEQLTKMIRPKFIPTIILGGTFNQDIQDSSMEDLIGTLCSLYKEFPSCARHYNNMAMIELNE